MQSETVTVRLSREAWERYSAEAKARGQGLAAYLRERLEAQDERQAEMAAIHQRLDRISELLAFQIPQPSDFGLIAETLLILRCGLRSEIKDTAYRKMREAGITGLGSNGAGNTVKPVALSFNS